MKKQKYSFRIAALLLAALLLAGTAMASERLVPGGHTIGLKAYARGLVVAEVEKGSPASRAGFRSGDVLTHVDEIALTDVSVLKAAIAQGETVCLRYTRGTAEKNASVTPMQRSGDYLLGLYVRDHVSGIGTVTYYDPVEGRFGALGHGVSDQTGEILLPITGGEVIGSQVREVTRGVSGTAGQLRGIFDPGQLLGHIDVNTASGVFGRGVSLEGEALPVASPEEVRTGPAKICSNVRGDLVETFDIEILKCSSSSEPGARNMLIRVMDKTLLALTGGIVQGMSGSPIIQNGKLVGAVTHVLVNDPTTGYGIFIGNMLDAAA